MEDEILKQKCEQYRKIAVIALNSAFAACLSKKNPETFKQYMSVNIGTLKALLYTDNKCSKSYVASQQDCEALQKEAAALIGDTFEKEEGWNGEDIFDCLNNN